jgi:hypothetical protein
MEHEHSSMDMDHIPMEHEHSSMDMDHIPIEISCVISMDQRLEHEAVTVVMFHPTALVSTLKAYRRKGVH